MDDAPGILLKLAIVLLAIFWPSEAWNYIWRELISFLLQFEIFQKRGPFLKLPPELRMMIIDRMRTEDRCRFIQCSKQCNKEAKSSRNYIDSLEMFFNFQNVIEISIAHNKQQKTDDYADVLKFENKDGKKWVRCILKNMHRYPLKFSELWKDELDYSTDLVQYAAGYFKKLLKEHQKNIKHLCFSGKLFETQLKDYDFGIENFASLKHLRINGNMNVAAFFSKLRHPLKILSISRNMNNNNPAECKQVYQVRGSAYMYDAKFTIEQFLQLSASIAHLNIGYLTEHDIYNFIRFWQNGTIRKEVREYIWNNLEDSHFDSAKLFKLFGRGFHYADNRWISIEIYNKRSSTRIGKLSYYHSYGTLKFEELQTN